MSRCLDSSADKDKQAADKDANTATVTISKKTATNDLVLV
jgi:hypothetical protein